MVYVSAASLAIIQKWEQMQDDVWKLCKSWQKKILSANLPTKKNDLSEVKVIMEQQNLSDEVVRILFAEIQLRENRIKDLQQRASKMRAHIERLGGDPGLTMWYKDSDFV